MVFALLSVGLSRDENIKSAGHFETHGYLCTYNDNAVIMRYSNSAMQL